MSVEVLLKNQCESTGEGPHWVPRTQSLLYVDINVGIVHRWDAVTGRDEQHKFDTTASFIVPCRSGGYIVGLGQSIVHFDWDTKTTTVLQTVDADKATRFNDGKCDARGRLWAGTMGEEKVQGQLEPNMGSLYSLSRDARVTSHREGVSVSNGLAWSADNKTMFYIDSAERKVWAYDYDIEAGAIANERTCVDFGGAETIPTLGYPDGMTIDTEDKLWVACYDGAKVIRFDPVTGKEMQSIQFPAKRITSCCFGGKDYDELYVTSAVFGATDTEIEAFPLAGSIFRVNRLGVKGYPAAVFERA